jgi:quercetin dioxygenase-like cupin family protein
MTTFRALIGVALLSPLVAGCHTVSGEQAAHHTGGPATTRTTLKQSLPRMSGEGLTVSVLEVEYQGGGSSVPHSHPCPVIGRILSGAIRTQVKGEPERRLEAGDTFYEAPNGVHVVSANASDAQPATFLAIFICDRDTPLSVAAPTPSAGDKQ